MRSTDARSCVARAARYAVALLALIAAADAAQAESLSGKACPDAGIWGAKLVTDICWSCLFPMRLLGVAIGGGDVPDGANTDPLCVCPDALGVPIPGFTMGMWQPFRLVEVVRVPYCSPTLGGITLAHSAQLGHKSEPELTQAESSFYQYHYFSFPLYAMLDLLSPFECNPGTYSSFDLMFLSELDPTWSDDELAFYLSPEAVVFARPEAQAVCAADCAATAAGETLEDAYWCAGCWGYLTPFVGRVPSDISPPAVTSLLAARALASLHRRGLAHKAYGTEAMCEGTLYPMIPKQGYRMQQLYPLAEASSSGGTCCHPIGQSTFQWGEWRNIPGVGEDFIHVLWRYTDCCVH